MRPNQPCLTCGTFTRNPGGRCVPCTRRRDRRRSRQPHRQAYADADYRTASRDARAGSFGPCVDCGTWDDLTLDHVQPLILGGLNHPSNWVVRCRPCNSSKDARTRRETTP
jgi:5-methylcytosine-specific restriction endonuclease McrA